MTQDLQSLLDKIQRDGVEKAQAEADRILGDARREAQRALDAAREEAAKIKADARREAEAFEYRAEETVRQAARDTLLAVERAVTALFERVLRSEVDAPLSDPTLVAALATEAVRAYLAGKEGVEVAAAPKLAAALRAKLTQESLSGVSVVTDESAGSGFTVRLDRGRIEHTFTGHAVADALSKLLRPQLAALLKEPARREPLG